LKEWLRKENEAFSDLVEKLCLELEKLKIYLRRRGNDK